MGALAAGQDRAGLVAEVARALAGLAEGARVVLAVSGGPDSTALAYLVTEARPDLEAHVGHVRHGLRADAADATVARGHADALDLAYHERSVAVTPAGLGPEAAAREARYAALTRIAGAVDARALLLGHTADDQAETVLLNVVRGAGLRGLTGMPATRPVASPPDPHDADVDETHGLRVWRPLLRLRRLDVGAFVVGEGLRAVQDPTNRDPGQRRARARQEVLPVLARLSGGSGDPVGALTRLADLARQDADALDGLAAEHARRVVVAWGPARGAAVEDLARLPRALATRVVRLLLRGVRGMSELSAATTCAVLDLAPGDALHVPGGVWVTAGGGWLAAAPADAGIAERPLALGGVTEVDELGLCLRTDTGVEPAGGEPRDGGTRPWSPPAPEGPLAAGPPGTQGAAWAALRLPGAARPIVRSRRSGDRFAGRRLTDVLGDAGVPRALRGLVPLVVVGRDEVVWVPGVGSASPAGSAGARTLRVWLAPREQGQRPG